MAANNFGPPFSPPGGHIRPGSQPSQFAPMMSPSTRPQRTRFGFHAPSPYPRPRSSLSKPNPGPLGSPISEEAMPDHYYMQKPNFSPSKQHFDLDMSNSSLLSNDSYHTEDGDSSYTTCPETSFGTNQNFRQFNADHTWPTNSESQNYGNFTSSPGKTGFQSSKFSGGGQKFSRQFKKSAIKRKAPPQPPARCDLCNLDFTSQIPLDMHLRGAKHAKKLKAIDILKTLQSQGQAKKTDDVSDVFRCDVCEVMLNGALQLQTHFDGVKHKNKCQQAQEKTEEPPAESVEKPHENGKETCKPPLEPESTPVVIDESRPTKMTKFSCEICNILVNSDIQLQQHLGSKRHQAKVEGKPITKPRQRKNKKRKLEDGENSPTEKIEEDIAIKNEPSESQDNALELSASVQKIPPLKDSFVKQEPVE